MTIVCPSCGLEKPYSLETCTCGADLRLLVQVNQLCDSFFNWGIQAAGQGNLGEALFWLSACCASRPTDAEAWLAHARAWGQLGHWQEGLGSLERARELNPLLAGLESAAQCLKEMGGRSSQGDQASEGKSSDVAPDYPVEV
jgi:tetratricopeptide (TPR) repeat protein